MLRSPVSRFTLAVVLWLPLCFGAWYYLAIVITWPLTDLVHWLMTSLLPEAMGARLREQLELLATATQSECRSRPAEAHPIRRPGTCVTYCP